MSRYHDKLCEANLTEFKQSQFVLALRRLTSLREQRELDEAKQQHEKMLQETWNQLDQDEQAIEEFCRDQ